MKTSLFATLATAVLLTATSAFAAPANDYNNLRVEQQGPGSRAANNDYRGMPQEQARWESTPRGNDRRADDRFDRNQNHGFDRGPQAARAGRRYGEEARNYGYARNYRPMPQERNRWETPYRR